VKRWLESLGYHAFLADWHSNDLINRVMEDGSTRNDLTPTGFCLLHATDFARHLEQNIIPPLKAGMLVVADRYVYTAFAREVVRRCHPAWVRKIYRFAPRPDIAVYLQVPIEVSMARIGSSRPSLEDFEAGMDLGIHPDPLRSYQVFQGRILKEYERVVKDFEMSVIQADGAIGDQQKVLRQIVTEKLEGYSGKARSA
jgi:dTMP kinase